MEELVYPAVLFKDDEKGTNTGWFTISVVDLGIVTEGETIEQAFVKAKEYLCAMVDCAIKFDCELEKPSKYEDVAKKYKNHIILLIDALA